MLLGTLVQHGTQQGSRPAYWDLRPNPPSMVTLLRSLPARKYSVYSANSNSGEVPEQDIGMWQCWGLGGGTCTFRSTCITTCAAISISGNASN